MTWLGLLNFLVLQWFGVRLERACPVSTAGMHYGDGPLRFSFTGMTPPGLRTDVDYYVGHPGRRFVVRRWILPLTGWMSDYRWIARRR